MAANDRIFYACQGVSVAPFASTANVTTGQMVHGLQSVGVTTNFSLEQAFELGQIEIYENIEGTPEIEVTMEKVIDGYPLIYHLATTGVQGGSEGLVNRSKQRCDVRLGIFPEEESNIGDGTGVVPVEVYMSGMYVSSISYSIPVDGNMTESVTLVGNNKQWYRDGGGKLTTTSVNNFDGADYPLALNPDSADGIAAADPRGGIQQKEDVIMSGCIFPSTMEGVAGATPGNGNGIIHVQSVSVSTDFSREDILELGRKTPYARPAAFPIEVSCEIEAISTSGDFVTATEAGDPSLYETIDSGNNTPNDSILIQTRSGFGLALGAKNRLQSVSYGGGDAGGGNVSCTYSYVNYNDLNVFMDTSDY